MSSGLNKYIDTIKKENPWFWDLDQEYNLVVTDDLDSILSALLLMQYRPNFHIGYYFDFKEGLYENFLRKDGEMIGIDLSATNIKCISNHVTALNKDDKVNPNDINLNYVDNWIDLSNYHSKYNLNTLCLVYSLLGLHPKDDEEASLLLLPDSAFQAHYANPSYKDSYVQKQILEKMDLMELYDLMNRYDKSKFYQAQEYFRIKSKFYAGDDGIKSVEQLNLEEMCRILGIDTRLLQELQGLFFMIKRCKGYTDLTYKKYDKSQFETFVVTSKDKVKFSKIEEDIK